MKTGDQSHLATAQSNGIKGQSLIEALVFLLLSIVVVKAVFAIFWIVINFICIEHYLYQSLICAASKTEITKCKRLALKQIRRLNPRGKITFLEIREFSSQFEGKIQWIFLKRKFVIHQVFIPPQY